MFKYFVEHSPTGMHLMFSYNNSVLWNLGRKTAVILSAHPVKTISMISAWLITTVDLDPLAQALFISFSTCKFALFSPFPYWTLWKEVPIPSPHLRNEELHSSALPLWELSTCSNNIFGILRQIFFFPLLIYLSIHCLI